MDTAADAVDDTEKKKMKLQYFVFLQYDILNFPQYKIKAAVRNLALKRLINRTACVLWKNVVAGATSLCLCL